MRLVQELSNHFLLPVLLPTYAAVGDGLHDRPWQSYYRPRRPTRFRLALQNDSDDCTITTSTGRSTTPQPTAPAELPR